MLNIDSIIDTTPINSNESFIENTIPKIKIKDETPLYTMEHHAMYLTYIPNDSEKLTNLFLNDDIAFLNKFYGIYKINEYNIKIFIDEVLATESKYVYPTVFVNFVKKELNTDKRITFDDNELLKLRVWSNQLRMIHKPSTSISLDEIYIAYKICCEMLNYAQNKESNDNHDFPKNQMRN